MIPEANDFLDESLALHALIADLDDEGLERVTAFKAWTISDVVAHLHYFNDMASVSLSDRDAFAASAQEAMAGLLAGASMKDMARKHYADGWGMTLVNEWVAGARRLAAAFAEADPKLRVKWFGPDMSARSAISARLMETWAHGQAVYDALGVHREDQDRIQAIAHLGVKTYGWSFQNRGISAPEPAPHLRLVAPSGAIWEFNAPNDEERIEGAASEFCQVVAQTRNVADTKLTVAGANAGAWMEIAQCFAGPAVDPPPPGTRRMVTPAS
ncbi:MAG: TIGR03084 family metal-binding protein [Pseudomonadota bacterium]